MPSLLQFAILVDRAQWLVSERMYDVARDHFLCAAEMAREAEMFRREDAQLHAAAECQALVLEGCQ